MIDKVCSMLYYSTHEKVDEILHISRTKRKRKLTIKLGEIFQYGTWVGYYTFFIEHSRFMYYILFP